MSGPALAPCDAFVASLGARAVGGLDDAGRAALEAHLATGCAGCAALAADLEVALDAVRLPEEEPAPGGWERVRLRLDDATAAPAEPVAVKVRCTYCRDDLARGAKACCAACLAPHHADCFAEHGRCAAPGCAETRTLEVRRPPSRGKAPWLLGGALLLVSGAAAYQLDAQRTRELAEAEARVASSQAQLEQVLAKVGAAPEPLYDGQPLSHWIASLSDRAAGRRQVAQEALVTFGVQAVPGASRALEHPSPDVRATAATTLAELRGDARAAIGPLTRALLTDETPAVRAACARALESIVYPLAQAAARDLTAACDALTRSLAEDKDAEVRVSACNALGALLPRVGPRPLTTALRKDPAVSVRRRAASWLLRAEPLTGNCVDALTEALERDASEDLRLEVVQELLAVTPEALRPQARGAAGRVLADSRSSPALRDRAAKALLGAPLTATDLLAMARAAPDVLAARETLDDEHSRDAFLGLLAGLPGLPEPVQYVVLEEAATPLTRLLLELGREPLAPLFLPEVSPRVRVLAASILLLQSYRAPDRPAVAVETARIVAPDLLRELDEGRDRSRAARGVVAALGTAAVTIADAMATRAERGSSPEDRGEGLELLSSVAPTDSRLDALTARALEGPVALRDVALRVAQHQNAKIGPQALLGVHMLLRQARNEHLCERLLSILERVVGRVSLDAVEEYVRQAPTDELAARGRALQRRVLDAREKPAGPASAPPR